MLYNAKYKALYKQHGMKPWEALVVPLVQLPIFVSFYVGISKMGLYCPGFEHGGIYWFTDLGAPGMLIPSVNVIHQHYIT
jgi:YidC/Oxa1 family membrane protein insertase